MSGVCLALVAVAPSVSESPMAAMLSQFLVATSTVARRKTATI